MIKELARKLATFKQFDDWVIIELEYRRGSFDSTAEVLKAHASMALLRAAASDAALSVKLIRPRYAIKPAFGCRIQSAEDIWRVFTSTEILDFAAAVGDKNPIHQLKPPIVPACLILETLCAEFDATFIKLKFKNFITADEPLSLRGNGERFEIISAGVRKVLGEFL